MLHNETLREEGKQSSLGYKIQAWLIKLIVKNLQKKHTTTSLD